MNFLFSCSFFLHSFGTFITLPNLKMIYGVLNTYKLLNKMKLKMFRNPLQKKREDKHVGLWFTHPQTKTSHNVTMSVTVLFV